MLTIRASVGDNLSERGKTMTPTYDVVMTHRGVEHHSNGFWTRRTGYTDKVEAERWADTLRVAAPKGATVQVIERA